MTLQPQPASQIPPTGFPTLDAPAIETSDLTKNFEDIVAVDKLCFRMPRGGVTALLGRTGSGKSTVLRMMVNRILPTSGSARLLGLDSRANRRELVQRVGYVAEMPALHDWMQVSELARHTASFYDRWNQPAVDTLLRRFDIEPGLRVSHLSASYYPKLALALAMGPHPELLIVDEPASGLDASFRHELLCSIIPQIRRTGCAVLFATHLPRDIEYVADEVVIIDRGRLRAVARIDEQTRRPISPAGDPVGLEDKAANLEDFFAGLVGADSHRQGS